MAKGQIRARKPKKDKMIAPSPTSAGSQVKLAGGTTGLGKKK